MTLRHFLVGLVFVGVIGCKRESQPLYDMYFYAKEDLGEGQNLAGIQGHPCGGVLAMRLSRIPEFPADGPIRTSEVLEFDSQDEIVQRWRAPADYILQAISGDRILLNIHGNGWNRFWVSTDGELEPSQREASTDAQQPRSCPETIRAYYESDDEGYPYCAVFVDELDGMERQIAFEPVCT